MLEGVLGQQELLRRSHRGQVQLSHYPCGSDGEARQAGVAYVGCQMDISSLSTFTSVLFADILRQRTRDNEVKKYCISLLEKEGSFEYTRRTLEALDEEANAEVVIGILFISFTNKYILVGGSLGCQSNHGVVAVRPVDLEGFHETVRGHLRRGDRLGRVTANGP